MIRFYTKQAHAALVFLLFVSSFFDCSPVAAMSSPSTFSIIGLTWNVGNTTAKDKIVASFAEEIKKLGKPDAIVLGTQEELAREGKQIKDKLLRELGKQSYTIAAQSSYSTAAGANNSNKTLALVAAQNTPVSKVINLPQNRSSLTVFVKKGITLANINKRIDYPPGQKKSNNAFILIEGVLKRGATSQSLPISVASVHLNSHHDKIRRSHATYFFDNQNFTNTNKTYDEVYAEAKCFYVVMGDFNERDRRMMDGTVVDLGRLTSFPAYGYDYAAKQERITPVYGTYGFTKLHDKTPVTLPDPRGRKHNAKGGYLDRIVVTSGVAIESPPSQYGAVISDEGEFKLTSQKKLFYAGSDHLPVLRFFSISLAGDEANSETIVKRYIKRRLPDFSNEIKDLQFLLDGKTLEDIKTRANKLIFYDAKGSVDDFLKQISNLESLTDTLRKKILWKKWDLEGLQKKIKILEAKIDGSHNPQFLATVYNKITICNQNRNQSLGQIDDSKAGIQWYIPNTLSQDSFESYKKTLKDLIADNILVESPIVKAETTPKSKGVLRSLLPSRKKRAT